MSSKSLIPVVLVSAAALAVGGYVYYNVQQVSEEMAAPAKGTVRKTRLHEMAEKGDVDGLRQEIKAGASIEQPADVGLGEREGLTPLMLACISGKSEAVKALLDAKASVHSRTKDGKTPLYFAAGWGDATMIKLLLDAGAAVETRTDASQTALMLAVARGDDAVVEELLARGADAKARNRWGQSVLHIAVQAGSPDKASALIKAGADVNFADDDGMTALARAAALSTDGDAGLKLVRTLLSKSADANKVDNEGVSPLMRAADAGDSARVEAMLAAGANPKLKDKAGRSAADWARNRNDDPGRAIAAIVDAAAQ